MPQSRPRAVLPRASLSARTLWRRQRATEFCAALDRYAERAMEIKGESTASVCASRPARAVLHQSHTS